MKSAVNPFGHKLKSRTLWIMAVIGLIIFLLIQVYPGTTSQSLQEEQNKGIITKEQAQRSAASYLKTTLGITEQLPTGVVTYDTHSETYGYLTKEQMMESYLKKYNDSFPLEFFTVRFANPDSIHSAIVVNVNMNNGQVVGFEKITSMSNSNRDVLLQLSNQSIDKLLVREGNLTLEEKDKQARQYLQSLHVNRNQIQPVSKEGDLGLLYQVVGASAGQSQGYIQFQFEYGHVSSIDSYFSPPQSHTKYVEDQTSLANWLTFGGYGLFTFVLAILAIVYSAKTRPYASFKRGIFLSSTYFVLSMLGAINMLPYLQKESVSTGMITFGLIIQGVFSLGLAASVYFSLVGGDGLLRKNNLNLWSRSKEPGYGRHVLSSMSDGYAWALILLGVQSVLFVILDKTLHFWATTDASQSTYNLMLPLLFPLLAWVAGIGEEAVYRLFGIPMLKKIVRNTFIASFITTMIWAFGHTLYPIYPVVTRPIELGVIGLIFSYIFLRYGFIAAVFSHVIFDSILMSLSLMFMGGELNFVAGIFYIVLPAIVAYVIYLFNPAHKERTPPNTKKEEPLIATPHPEGQL